MNPPFTKEQVDWLEKELQLRGSERTMGALAEEAKTRGADYSLIQKRIEELRSERQRHSLSA